MLIQAKYQKMSFLVQSRIFLELFCLSLEQQFLLQYLLLRKRFTCSCILDLRIFNDPIICNEHSLPHIPKRKQNKKIFRKFDHISIFILIAGTYTPACAILVPNKSGLIILCIVWSLAIIGIIFKIIFTNSPGWFNGFIFIIMGWIIIFKIKPIYKALNGKGFFWLVFGGIVYTIGGIVYILSKKFNPTINMKMHDVFHILIIIASASHFWLMLKYISNF